jgi:DMSO reductase iron-sulfur subunit
MYSFFFDSSSCSGCKACQAACKDKHGLEVGMLWRRVYEVSGGGWQRVGEAWISDVYAYNLSISCNHCEQPSCVEACPTTALYKRADGLVLIEPERCIGCKYCTWACPYGAPQYDANNRVMTKCTGCVDYLESGLPPACVAACPLRVLDFGDSDSMQARYALSSNGLVQSVAPLPEKELTQPGLLIRPHRDTERAAQGMPRLANLEEVHTAPPYDERPLVLFTVLAQMAVGAFITLGLFDLRFSTLVTALPVLVMGVIMVAALLLSLVHLGQPQRAYRAIANWRTSWLSREILSAGAFTGGVILFNLLQWFYPSRYLEMAGETYRMGLFSIHSFVFYLTALAGLALVYNIPHVYRLRTVKIWDSWHTTAAFLVTPLLLGPLLAGVLLFLDSLPVIDFFFNIRAISLLQTAGQITLVTLLAAAVQMITSWPEHLYNRRYSWLRLGLLASSAIAAGLIWYPLSQSRYEYVWSTIGILMIISFIFALASELLGRWMFYEKKTHSGL